VERIYEKALRGKAIEQFQILLDSVKGLPPGSPDRQDAYIGALEKLIGKMENADVQRDIWDFSYEKKQPVFAQNDKVVIRPVAEGDADLYVAIRMQYSMIYRAMIGTGEHCSASLFLSDLCQPESFYCMIENTKKESIGYLGIKDTGSVIWELAIEMDKQHTQHGFGPRSILLFLNTISSITGRTTFKAAVEADNIPSQKCFERIGAELVGLCDGPLLKTADDKKRFEESNLHLIDDNIRILADRLSVEPRKLLSHVLEYHMKCPLRL